MNKSALLLLGAAALCGCQQKAEKKPNVLIVLADDQGYGDFGSHGNTVLKTPNLDIMHQNSVSLTDFHVAPVSTPTRGELLTGRDAMRNGAWSWGYSREMISEDVPSMGEIFSKAGYSTAHFGKWHLCDNYPYRSQDKGFQETVTFGGAATHQSPDYWQNDNFDDHYLMQDGTYKQFEGFCTDIWFDLSMDFMSRCKKDDKPFLVYLPTNAAHDPLYVAEEYCAPYRNLSDREATFFGTLANLDENMGRMNKYLKDNDLYDNTIVVYLTDNGGTFGCDIFNAGMKGKKGSFYDGGHRGACYIQWPEGLKEKFDMNQLTGVQDILPTLLDFCEIEVDKSVKDGFDGTSLKNVLQDKEAKLDDRMIVVQHATRPELVENRAAVLWDKWRMVMGKELYNIEQDPGQERNIAKENPEILAQMQQHYNKWWKETKPIAEKLHRIIVGSSNENPMQLSCFDMLDHLNRNSLTLQKTIWSGLNVNGTWYLKSAQAGKYRITLRRYPIEADFAISGAYPATKREFASFEECKALPIVSARIAIDKDQISEKAISATDKSVSFEVELPKGDFSLNSWFLDKDNESLTGAYYVEIERL